MEGKLHCLQLVTGHKMQPNLSHKPKKITKSGFGAAQSDPSCQPIRYAVETPQESHSHHNNMAELKQNLPHLGHAPVSILTP